MGVEEEVRALTKSVDKLIGNMGKSGSSGSGSTPSSPTAFDSAATNAAKTLEGKFTNGLGLAADGFSKLKSIIDSSVGTFQDLSKAGMSFSGDLVGMKQASLGMRLETKDMADMLSKNTDLIAGFGSNMTTSAEKFAKASKYFFDNNTEAADNLRRMGYTAKDLNEIIMLQGVNIKGSFKNEEERNRVLSEHANKFATEMDLTAKLTGKSREQQMEAMKKQQVDMQFQAALELKSREIKDPKERAAFEDNARKQFLKAEAQGVGDKFKEMFATNGNVMTQASATWVAGNKEQADALRKSVMAASNASLTADERKQKADKADEEMRMAQLKDSDNANKQFIRSLGSATAMGDMYNKSAGDFNAVTKNIKAAVNQYNETAAEKDKIDLKTDEGRRKAAQMFVQEAEEAQKGRRKNEQGVYEQVDGATKAAVNAKARAEDITNALSDSLVTPLNKRVSPELGKFADTILHARGNLDGLIGQNSSKKTVYQAAKEETDKGQTTKKPANAAQKIGAAGALAIDTVDWLSRSNGSLESTGSIFENFKTGTPVMLHGMESVMRPEDLGKMAQVTMEGAMKSIPKTGMLDLSKQSMNTVVSDSRNAKDSLSNTVKTDLSSSVGKEIDMKSMKFDRFGMPITKDIKYKAEEMSAEVKKNAEEKKNSESTAAAKASAPAPAAPKEQEKKPEAAKPAASSSKESSLSDVVASLNQLNSKVSQLIDVQKDIGMKQVKATKSNSGDIYQRS